MSASRSSVTPVVLREDARPPTYGERYSENASRQFYTQYLEYKKRAAHANAGGAVQRQVVSMSELIPSHVQRVFSRLRNGTRSLSTPQLAQAVKSHAGHEAGADVELSAASAAVAKAVAMNSSGKTLLEKVEPIMSNLEKCFAENPNFEAVYRSSEGVYLHGPAEIITKALVEGLAPDKFQQDVRVKLQHAGDCKNDPDLVMDTVVAEAKEWRKIEAFSRSSTSTPVSPRRPGSKSVGSSKKRDECHRCGQKGHYKRDCPASPSASSTGERSPRKGRGKGNRRAGREQSSKDLQKEPRKQPGPSGKGPGAAAPQRTVQVGTSSTEPATTEYDEMCQSVEFVTSVDFVTVGFIEMFGDITGAC